MTTEHPNQRPSSSIPTPTDRHRSYSRARRAQIERRVCILLLLVLAAPTLLPTKAAAKNHAWRINEFFSNADGSIQFIELWESEGSDVDVLFEDLQLLSNTQVFTFPADLIGPTGHKFLLVATQGFANMPGAPTPDHIIPDNFFSANDFLRYANIIDIVPTNSVPLDGVNSAHRDFTTGGLVTAINSPTNYAGTTGQIDASSTSPVPSLGRPGWTLVALLCAGLGLIALGRRFRTTGIQSR
jgi:hypothetical protein